MRVASVWSVVGLLGCSSVPAVTFADADAAVDAAVAPSSPQDAGTAYSCPSHPPPPSVGVCCDTRLCVKCSTLQCDRCQKEACGAAEVCCAKNAGTSGASIECTAQSACN